MGGTILTKIARKPAVTLTVPRDGNSGPIEGGFNPSLVRPVPLFISKGTAGRLGRRDQEKRHKIAAEIATLKKGDAATQRSGVEISTPSVEDAAKVVNVSRDTVFDAKTVLKTGTPEEIAIFGILA